MKTKRYKPNTPPAKNYPMVGKSTLVMWDLLARCYGWEVPHMEMVEVRVDELRKD